MTVPTAIVFGGGLVALLLFIVAALMWQETRSTRFDDAPIYVIDDAVEFIRVRLAAGVADRLDRSDVQRILEWEIFYLQGLAQKRRNVVVETVAGGVAPAIEYITAEIANQNRVIYDPQDVAAVLSEEAEYLHSIGAVGDRVVDEQEDGTS